MNTLIVGDIHGCGYTLKDFIAEFRNWDVSVDRVIFLGDYIDRGLNSKEVIQCLRYLKDIYKENLILLRGNHELMVHEFLRTEEYWDFYTWNVNGAQTTLNSYDVVIDCNEDGETSNEMWKFREDMNWLFINSQWTFEENNKLFCAHSCFVSLNDDDNKKFLTYESNPTEYDFYENLVWDRDCDHNGIEDSAFFHGHTIVSAEESIKGEFSNCINLDSGCFLGRGLRYALITDDEEINIYHYPANEKDIDKIWKSWKE